MTKWILLFAAALTLSAADPKSEVLSAIDAWKQAVLKKDGAALNRLLHADLTYSHSDARTESKTDILNALPDIKSVNFADTNVRVYGNTALAKGTAQIVSVTNGATTTSNLSVLQVWLKGPAGWQLVARQSTKLP
ncbi:MAG TPA: nuclear transport factor 2 family protein [Bryobacteraceae bacterium]|nr:nuclear transport factor 2 family protein [Bryobacteraceae bacterium]